MRICFIHRAPGLLQSIEGLFKTISAALPKEFVAYSFFVSSPRANPTSVLSNLRSVFSIGKADLFHVTGDIHYAVLAIWRRPSVLTIHDLRFLDDARGMKRCLLWLFWLYLPCLRATRITVISEFTRRRLFAHCRLNSKKVQVIGNCVSVSFQASAKKWSVHPRLLLVGTTPNKNLERVVKSCFGIDVALIILGRLENHQRDLLISSALAFEEHHSLDQLQVVALYQSCDLVCFLSTYEGFGLPILEAQAVGRPILTSNIAPMCDVAGAGALTVDPFSESAIREGLLALLTQPVLRSEIVRLGFDNVRHYSASAIAAQYADLYRELAGPS